MGVNAINVDADIFVHNSATAALCALRLSRRLCGTFSIIFFIIFFSNIGGRQSLHVHVRGAQVIFSQISVSRVYVYLANNDCVVCRQRPWRLLLYTTGALLTIPFNIWIENLAVLWGMFGHKHQFYVVKKDWQTLDV